MEYTDSPTMFHKPHHYANGYLELIIGPMFSGKTTFLVDTYRKCKLCNIPTVVINHCSDNRYCDSPTLSTHDLDQIPCVSASHLSDVDVSTVDVILVNEGQFFDDLVDTVYKWIATHKCVYVAGLDGDYLQKKIGGILDLIPISDKVSKLTSLCGICCDGTPGIFSKRITQETEQIVIGSDNYKSVCRKCL